MPKIKKQKPQKSRKTTKKAKILNLPKTVISPKSQEKSLKQKFTTGYYHCLANS
jgi:hypothetical protein